MLLFVFLPALNRSPGKLSIEAIQVVFEELRKKGEFSSVRMCRLGILYSLRVQHTSLYLFFPLLLSNLSGNLEWLDKNKSRCLVMWRRPEEWGKLIHQWVSRGAFPAHAGLSERRGGRKGSLLQGDDVKARVSHSVSQCKLCMRCLHMICVMFTDK